MSDASTIRYRGTLALHDHSEGWDILFLDDAVGNYDEPLAEVISDDMERHGEYLSVRYWTAGKTRSDEEMIDGAIREMLGFGEAEFRHAYSDITGYLWTDEDIRVGGHDLLEELKSQAGRYCLLEIGYAKEPVTP
jgi:hypothetical protein